MKIQYEDSKRVQIILNFVINKNSTTEYKINHNGLSGLLKIFEKLVTIEHFLLDSRIVIHTSNTTYSHRKYNWWEEYHQIGFESDIKIL